MRVIRNGKNPQAINFVRYLLDIGDNNMNIERLLNTNTIRILDNLLIENNLPNTPESLIISPIIKRHLKLKKKMDSPASNT